LLPAKIHAGLLARASPEIRDLLEGEDIRMRILRTLACAVAVAIGSLAASSGAQAQSAFGDPLFAVLVGNNECDAAAVCKKGDPDGIGSVTLIFPTTTSVCWGLTVDNLDKPTAAHIHSGTPANNGAPVVTLIAPIPPANGNPGTSSGCVTPVAAGTIAAIKADPTRFYVNVHTTRFPNGAIRGQLH
jgi:hypothetical protein